MGDTDASTDKNGKITTREFYNALLDVKDEIAGVKTGIATLNEKVDGYQKDAQEAKDIAVKARDDVANMKTWSNRFDGVLGAIAAAGVVLGIKQ